MVPCRLPIGKHSCCELCVWQPCHVQRKTFHCTPPHLLVLTIFPLRPLFSLSRVPPLLILNIGGLRNSSPGPWSTLFFLCPSNIYLCTFTFSTLNSWKIPVFFICFSFLESMFITQEYSNYLLNLTEQPDWFHHFSILYNISYSGDTWSCDSVALTAAKVKNADSQSTVYS